MFILLTVQSTNIDTSIHIS